MADDLTLLLRAGVLNWQPAAPQIAQLELLVDELLRWNQRRNLTAITARAEIYEKHLYDSLTLLPLIGSARRLLDIGSGAGFPGLVLKVACPELEVVSVDAAAKKVAFQRHAARKLGLSGFTALHARAETLPDHSEVGGGFDLVTARALGSLELLVALAGPCLAPDGRLVAMKGPDWREELDAGRDELTNAGWTVRSHELELPVSRAGRCLLEFARCTA